MMHWKKYDLIFDVRNNQLLPDFIGFFQSPQALVLPDRVRIYGSSRRVDANDSTKFLSHVVYVDFDKDLNKVLDVSKNSVIPLGARGTFDEHGIFPFSPLCDGDRILAYTCGWSRRVSVSVETATGFAESFDGGHSFQKLGHGQIFGASLHEPFLVGDSFVRRYNNMYHMWYMFGQKWVQEQPDTAPDRVYKIGHAISNDGLNFVPDYKAILPDMLHEHECQALPSVLYFGGLYHMVFCYRDVFGFRHDSTKSYRLGYAYSADLTDWYRDDRALNLNTGDDGAWDSDMMCYPHLFEMDGRIYLLYNGNEFGKHGFGVAVLTAHSELKTGTSSANQILSHLKSCDTNFLNHLSARVNVNDYAEKLFNKAIRIEAWDNDCLIGFLAMYHNIEDNSYFISNVSVINSHSGRGVASQLMALALAKTNGAPIKLEVRPDNAQAIKLYKKFGFLEAGTDGNNLTMLKH